MKVASREISHLDVLKQEINSYQIRLMDAHWQEYATHFSERAFKKRDDIFKQTEVCRSILYITEGIAASQYIDDGETVITRFFRKGNFCANLISAAYSTLGSDNVIAITDVKGICMPFRLFQELYFHSNTLGLFIRKKMLENNIEAKNFISIKTISNIEKKYHFMEEHYPEIIRNTPSKYIANFFGITPEWLSRFLKNRMSA